MLFYVSVRFVFFSLCRALKSSPRGNSLRYHGLNYELSKRLLEFCRPGEIIISGDVVPFFSNEKLDFIDKDVTFVQKGSCRLLGTQVELHQVWNDYGVQIQVTPAGAMVAHGDIVYIIDKSGHTREILDSDPGDGSAPSQSSFSALLTSQVQHIAHS